jgi:diguanylate cyclase (GGDEF)-like protein/PAS domain S-box-containing protein
MPSRASKLLGVQKAGTARSRGMDPISNSPFGPAENLGQVGIWWINLATNTIRWSDEVYQLHGLSADQFTPDLESAISFYHPDDRGAIDAVINTAAVAEAPFEVMLRLNRVDGQRRHVKARGYAIPASENVPAHIFGVLIDVTEAPDTVAALRAENLRLKQLAYVDALTLLANRRQFDDTLNSEWLRAIREETPISLIMLDIDQFKHFNDRYGHAAGDACLRVVAKTLRASLRRPGDLVARYGGEEFALLLPGTVESGAVKLAQAVLAAIEALQLTHAGNAACGGIVTASFGVSTAYPSSDDPDGWLSLISNADAMLYEAKRTGRNRVVATGGVGDQSHPALSLLDRVRDDLQRKDAPA